MTQPPPPPPGATPPPPPPPPPEGVTLDVGAAFTYGWNAWVQNIGPMIGLAAIIVGVNIVIGLIGSGVDSLVGTVLLQAISMVVGIVLAMGLIRAALAVTEGRTPSVSMFLETDGFWSYLVASLLVGIGILTGLILLIVPGIILAVMWQFFGYVIVDRPGTRAVESMGRSADITRGNRWPLFGLVLLLLLINILGAVLCGVGLIATYGVTALTIAYAYKVLSGEPVAGLAR